MHDMRAEQLTDAITEHGEGPVWDAATGRLRLVDMLRGDVVSVQDGREVERRHVGQVAALWRPRTGGGAVVAVERGFALIDAESGQLTTLPEIWTDPNIRMNEGGCDPLGRLYCGSMAYRSGPGAGTLYRLDADYSVHRIVENVTTSNGLAWNPAGDQAYYVDTPTHRIDVFDFDRTTGELTERRTFARIPDGTGGPDGLTVDADGGVWVALWGGSAVRRYGPTGELEAVIELPTRQVTACTFGGPQLDQLFITTSAQNMASGADPYAGAVFTLDPGVKGMLPLAFSG
jgi:sugar lactone lactonase YvrE